MLLPQEGAQFSDRFRLEVDEDPPAFLDGQAGSKEVPTKLVNVLRVVLVEIHLGRQRLTGSERTRRRADHGEGQRDRAQHGWHVAVCSRERDEGRDRETAPRAEGLSWPMPPTNASSRPTRPVLGSCRCARSVRVSVLMHHPQFRRARQRAQPRVSDARGRTERGTIHSHSSHHRGNWRARPSDRWSGPRISPNADRGAVRTPRNRIVRDRAGHRRARAGSAIGASARGERCFRTSDFGNDQRDLPREKDERNQRRRVQSEIPRVIQVVAPGAKRDRIHLDDERDCRERER